MSRCRPQKLGSQRLISTGAARWTRDDTKAGRRQDPQESPKTLAVQGFSFVAGAGFEPATFGL